MGKSKAYPDFFAVHMPQATSRSLRIPHDFIASLDKEIPKQSMLRNRAGRLWEVKVVKTDNGVYFMNGWEQFLKDNSVKIGEFMVFKYNGDRIFSFILLSTHGCEREDIISAVKQERDDDDADVDDDDDGDDADVDDDDDGDDADVDADADDDDDGDDVDADAADDDGADADDDGGDDGNDDDDDDAGDRSALNCDEYVDRKNPYFVVSTRAMKYARLHVPRDVVTAFDMDLHQGMEVIFRVPNGRDWRGKVTKWKDGRVWIRRWRTFCKWNRVTEHDKCICEFLDEGRSNVICVHIVRA